MVVGLDLVRQHGEVVLVEGVQVQTLDVALGVEELIRVHAEVVEVALVGRAEGLDLLARDDARMRQVRLFVDADEACCAVERAVLAGVPPDVLGGALGGRANRLADLPVGEGLAERVAVHRCASCFFSLRQYESIN